MLLNEYLVTIKKIFNTNFTVGDDYEVFLNDDLEDLFFESFENHIDYVFRNIEHKASLMQDSDITSLVSFIKENYPTDILQILLLSFDDYATMYIDQMSDKFLAMEAKLDFGEFKRNLTQRIKASEYSI